MDLETNLERLLEEALASKTKGMDPTGDLPPSRLAEAIRYSLLGPGKRIRPRLVLTSAEMMGLAPSTVMPTAIALEMIHCFTLIHDDLPCMDNDDFRRGRPSNHKKFGESLALLAGDSLMALAFDTYLDSSAGPDKLIGGLKYLLDATGPRGVIGGQAAESYLTENSTLQDLLQVHQKKTGALFSAALFIPQVFAGISNESAPGKAINAFAKTLGLAFQAADDLEDSQTVNVKPPVTSILRHLTKNDIVNQITRELAETTDRLHLYFAEKSIGLKKIADEILNKVTIAAQD